MSISLERGPTNLCLECGRGPIAPTNTFCSIECASAYEFTPTPKGTYSDMVWEDDPDDGLEPVGPVMYGEVDTVQRSDPRECNECGERVSAAYARTFARENGDLWCANCRPRSARYTNAPTYGPDHKSDPSTVTGSNNPRSDARK